jgi:manganese transport protein
MQSPTGQGISRAFRQALGYLGPGFFVTVGFIDPGNWAANIAAGSDFGYQLLWVVTLSTLVLILWQHMSAHLGIVTGKCLAEMVHDHVRPTPAIIYGATAVAACVATAVAEILGAAVGLDILFHIPLRVGTVLATAFVGAMIWFQGYRSTEKLIIGFVAAIGFCYLAELVIVKPDWGLAARDMVVPTLTSGNVVIAMAMLGAVVMPHNMYLHSEVIQNRQWQDESEASTRRLLRFEFLDTLISMLVGLAINAAMVIVAAAVFHQHGRHVTELPQAAATLQPLAGSLASLLFGIGLLFAGVSSSVTAGIAGGTTVSGYLGRSTDLQSRPFRAGMLLTLVPACVIVLLVRSPFQALIASQVCLSIQLPFTMLPLLLLTSSRSVMGRYANGWFENTAMVVSGLVILGLNGVLLYQLAVG